MDCEMPVRAERSWNGLPRRYACCDRAAVTVLRRTASVRDLYGRKTVPGSGVAYARDEHSGALLPRIEVSGVEYDRGMETVFGGSDDIRTMTFPNTVRTIRQSSFHEAKSLRSVVLNEGLEVLGTREHTKEDARDFGVFQESGLERVRLPSTLRRIEHRAFMFCGGLETVDLPDGLECMEKCCFLKTGLRRVKLPASLRTVAQGVFARCGDLRTATFGEGLEVLGTDEYISE